MSKYISSFKNKCFNQQNDAHLHIDLYSNSVPIFLLEILLNSSQNHNVMPLFRFKTLAFIKFHNIEKRK